MTHHQASYYIYIVIDKPDFLPPPRSIVHKARSSKSKSNQDSITEPTVSDESQIPHGNAYTSFLAKYQGFKAKLLEYLTETFLSHATSSTNQYSYSMILDSTSLQSLSIVQGGNVYTSDGNQDGEAGQIMLFGTTVCIPSPTISSSSLAIQILGFMGWEFARLGT